MKANNSTVFTAAFTVATANIPVDAAITAVLLLMGLIL